uniref:Uncharacterized protein n=1 Tax=Knipowitschia caucasica TaxID=637954 RepID=A0AAV2KU71_KNICA
MSPPQVSVHQLAPRHPSSQSHNSVIPASSLHTPPALPLHTHIRTSSPKGQFNQNQPQLLPRMLMYTALNLVIPTPRPRSPLYHTRQSINVQPRTTHTVTIHRQAVTSCASLLTTRYPAPSPVTGLHKRIVYITRSSPMLPAST